ncbi:MAG TPA: DUF1566 domain-containing protein [Smithellaceae bacterium]|nr:DUF1566 domain-containing protein [Smithellaceae bacterium]HRS82934.1 DUF1566 domain-containing protein [Smithellaceae bacterium]HRV45690.1 DUF1566 domain-containing protein [Smithellaceae bacterium]
MKRTKGIVLVAWVLLGVFVCAGTASAANETGREGRFIAYDDGTVLDTATNLMWADKDNGVDIQWAAAKTYCESFTAGGYNDWRMPTKNELAGLYDGSRRDARGYHLATSLITLSGCCPWTSDTCISMLPQYEMAGYYAFHWSFISGQSICSQQGLDRDVRVLPVRSRR